MYKAAIVAAKEQGRANFWYPVYSVGKTLEYLGRHEEALKYFRESLAMRNDGGLLLHEQLFMTHVYTSEADLKRWRQRFSRNLAKLKRERINLQDPFHSLFDVPHYYLGYHGENDVDMVKDIATVIRQSAPDDVNYVAPAIAARGPSDTGPPLSQTGGRIRIGFISLYFKSHASAKMMKGVMARLDRSRFEVIVFSLRDLGKPFDERGDPIARSIKRSADEYVACPKYSLHSLREAVEARNLHVLVFAEIGMDPGNYLLSFSRLAPIQIATHGHVYTTGVDTIDWYITYEMFECQAGKLLCPGPQKKISDSTETGGKRGKKAAITIGDAQDHYSERLALMTGLNFYDEPYIPQTVTPRSNILDTAGRPLPDDAVLFLVPQTLYKITPTFDEVYRSILERLPTARLVLKELKGELGNIILARLKNTMPSVLDRVIMLPGLSDDDFMSLYRIADVMLDPYPFGGYTTSFEGFSAGIPTVTLPHYLMMGRCTLGMYERMEILDLVAKSRQEYIDLAVALGESRKKRDNLRARILENKHMLFDQTDGVASWERFLEDVVNRKVSEECKDKSKPACVFGDAGEE